MGLNEIQVSVIVDAVLDISEGDYTEHNGIKYTLNRDAEYTIENDVKYSYDLVFEHPMFVFVSKLIAHRTTGSTNFTLTGKLSDFVALIVWCINLSTENPLGVDAGWSVGSVVETEYKNITFTDVDCREALKILADAFQAEFFFSGIGKTVNFVERIENITSFVFEQGKEKGLYKITQQNVDKEDTVTRVYVRGGNQNVPNEYADEDGFLKLPENYLENFTEHSKVVERKVKFEEEYPHFTGSVATVAGMENVVITCPQIDFDVAALAVGTNARINFLTGDLMGNSFEFQWENSTKKITLVEKDDDVALPNQDGTKPKIPSAIKKAKVGDTFNFTGILMPQSYTDASIVRLRAKGNKWLSFFSKKRVKFDLDIDHRWLRGKAELKTGDVVIISIPQKSFYQAIRITQIEKNIYTGAVNATVSNYLEEKWDEYLKDRIEEVKNNILSREANLKTTLEYIFKDGIITESELSSIEAVLSNLKTVRGQLNAQYLVVRGNADLVNKTPLETAWSNYQTAYINVETSINNAISDKRITEAEKADIETKIEAYRTRINEFTTALENAREAIENKKNQGILDVAQRNIDNLQAQIDGEVSNWFYAYSPTLANYPASDWTTNAIKDRHVGDTFTNTAQAPATDAGKSWRFVKNGTVYSWTQIADSDAVLALQKAAEAKATADGKSTTYLIQPTSYHLGDTWVLGADRTVNGVAYKAGEILTATQDSTTFVESHWVKKVRYTDDTAVNNLQIGGVNMLRDSKTPAFGFYEGATGLTRKALGSEGTGVGDVWYIRNETIGGEEIKALKVLGAPGMGEVVSVSFNVRSFLSTPVTFHSNQGARATTITNDGEMHRVKWEGIVGDNYGNVQVQIRCDGKFELYIWDLMYERGNKCLEWRESTEDVQARIDAAVVKATYWSVKASAPVIYKDAINAATSGTHTPVTVSGELRSGTTTTAGGFITVTPNGGTEAGTASASPVTISPANGDGKTSYTVRLYDTAAKATLLDTMTIPVVFKGASGVNAINVVLSNEADVLPASTDGTVSDYSGSGTIIRVFEGATELDYDGIGTANGKFNVTASAAGITAGTKSESGLTCVFANASNMTADNATIVFTITGKTADGTSFSITKTQSFAKSRTGAKGDAGVSITAVDVEFAKNTNPTTAPTTGWNTTAPTLAEGEQLWTRTKTTYSAGNPTYSTPANITPKKGDTGAEGQGIDSVTEEYAISTSKTTQPTTGWSTTQPDWVQGQYIWSRVKVVYKNPASTVYTGYAVSSEWEAVNNLQIGGVNMLRDSKTPAFGFYEGATGLTRKVLGSEGAGVGDVWYIRNETIGGEEIKALKVLGAPGMGEVVSVSFNVRSFLSTPVTFHSNQGARATTITNDGEMHRVKWEGIVGDNYGNVQVQIRCDGKFELYIWDLMYERGNKCLEWRESTEDVQARIDAEKARINEILSDNIADPSEKQYLSNLWQEIYAEYPRYWNQAHSHGVDKSNYEAKYTALNNILSPVLSNLTVNSTVSGASIRTAFNQYYDARAVLINNVTNKVNATAAAAKQSVAEHSYLKEALKQESEVTGGLFLSSVIAARDAVTDATGNVIRKVRAYMNGMLSKNKIAFAAGVDNFARTDNPNAPETQKTWIDHEGNARIGNLKIGVEGDGTVRIEDGAGVNRIEFSVNNLKNLSYLQNANEITTSAAIPVKSFSNTENYNNPNLLTVSQDGSEITVQTTISVYAEVQSNPNDSFCRTEISLMLYRNNGYYAHLGAAYAIAYRPGYNTGAPGEQPRMIDEPWSDSLDSRTEQINVKLIGVPAGTYKLVAQYAKTFTAGSYAMGDGTLSAGTMTSVFRVDNRQITIGKDGISAFFSKTKYVHIQNLEGTPMLEVGGGMRVKGESDAPGVLCAGRVSAAGAIQFAWGAKKNRQGQSSPLTEKISGATGRYRVYHSIGHTDYIPKLTGGVWYYQSNRRAGCPGWENIQPYYFDVFMMTDGGDVTDCAFSYECTGNNY